jgi:hypothetical protein
MVVVVVPDPSEGFDETAILAMGIAFERACLSLQTSGIATTVREIIATHIVKAAARGERDPDRLHDEALKVFDIEKRPIVSVA